MSTLSKSEQRKICLENRTSISFEKRNEYSEQICKVLADLPAFKNAKTVLSYAAAVDEADPSYLPECGKQFAFPVSYSKGIMEARIPDKQNGWECGKFGIKSPKVSNSVLVDPDAIDLVIVPCVGFDDGLRRLGHGMGYYDRFLPLCKNAVFICIAFENQKLDNITTDAYDIRMDCIISEKNIYS